MDIAKINIRLIVLMLLIALGQSVYAQFSESVFANGKWVKARVYRRGMYKLTYEYLKKAGIDKPEEIVVIGRGGAFEDMMNSADVPGITLMPLFCDKGEDGEFGKGDYYLFFAKGPEDIIYDTTLGEFMHRKNQYEDFATYFIGYGDLKNKIIPIYKAPQNDSYLEVEDSDYFFFHEKSLRNLLKSGRNKVGEKFSATVEYSFKINIPDINVGENIKIKTSLLARGISASDFDIVFNGKLLGTLRCDKVDVTSFSSPFADAKLFKAEAEGKEDNDLRIKFKRDGGNVGCLVGRIIWIKYPRYIFSLVFFLYSLFIFL